MFSGVLVFGTVSFFFCILRRFDRELEAELSSRAWVVVALVCILGASVICSWQQDDWSLYIRGIIMLIYLIFCSVTDYYTQQVYDLIQLGACIVVLVSILQEQVAPMQGAELIIYALVQGVVFKKMYGEADVMCFLICALSMAERGIFIWTCHMGISFLLLGVMQGIKGNIGKDGNLKAPVAFFPYMTAAYVMVF